MKWLQRGVTMVEALVALVVLSIGLLGIAGLFVESLRNSRTALFRTHAANLAGDIADRIRANGNGRDAYDTTPYAGAPALHACAPTAAFAGGHYLTGALYLALLAIVFIGMGATVLSVVQGRPSERAMATPYRDSLGKTAPILFAMALVLLLGLWLPEPLRELIEQAAAGFEVHR